ncbi:MAG: MotA/TolQ/ExbB proton channel family protein [Candidatus Omnitrophica bacterium]|nr:MotA/TolQ/ExbB proton channel family protein [Candidatus Omnitrophota bacterium]MCF7891372.1 MotA/TolQ/ExbB proton channel family protein [Candidatus Omnitrophota bacterium]MCF7895696.1 MotA/TolQ/ExbB proton channel family protein [Candidatus Omnitrophota bacterium]MCF7897896.1 MotA/TolQ/ExbB proton channel family protein [Candidatus Omnitrophota bacterium]MCF7909043.1 MotA/TolQ/ExbB proton channel family protein [Candidatus Omnitrophota bacterium]
MEELILGNKQLLWLISPIVLCSIFSVAIMLERFFFYLTISGKKTVVLSEIIELTKKNKITEAIELCQKKPFYGTNILKAGLSQNRKPKKAIEEAMENASLYEVPKLEKNLNFLGTIAHITPLLGLLGTVIGMVNCFYTIEQVTQTAGMVNPTDLAGGIWTALLTTAAGLSVAIPSYIMYNYFIHKVRLLTLVAERASTELLEILSGGSYSNEI